VKSWWRWTGLTLYWLTWPLMALMIRGSKRTRLLIVYCDEVLVTKGWLSSGKWSLPGGGLHKGEQSLAGALRELYEETGLRLRTNQVKRHSDHIYQHNGVRFNYVLFTGVLRRKVAVRPQPLEILEVSWVDRHELTAANASPDVLNALHIRWGTR